MFVFDLSELKPGNKKKSRKVGECHFQKEVGNPVNFFEIIRICIF